MELARRVSRSLWALVPDPSGDTGQEQVTGSAVALGPGRLLAVCGALGRRTEVALRRHEERRTARVAGSDPTGQACLLAVPDDTPLDPPQGVRDPAGLRPGEAVYAVYNETVDEGVLVEGRLEDARGGLLRASLGLPGGVGGAVLFDADGNLVGVGAATRGRPAPPGPCRRSGRRPPTSRSSRSSRWRRPSRRRSGTRAPTASRNLAGP